MPDYPRPGCTEPGCGYPDPCDGCLGDALTEALRDDPGVPPDRCPACRAVLVGSWTCRVCGPPPLAGLDLGASRR